MNKTLNNLLPKNIQNAFQETESASTTNFNFAIMFTNVYGLEFFYISVTYIHAFINCITSEKTKHSSLLYDTHNMRAFTHSIKSIADEKTE